MTSRGREGEGFPVPAHVHAHMTAHTENPPHPPPPPPARIGEAASYRPCPRCDRPLLVARSGGLLVKADPENLTVTSELVARMQGRFTFDIHLIGLPRRMYLEYRDVLRIRAPRRYPVVAAHQCGSELTLLTTPTEATEIVISYRKDLPDVPQF